MSLEQWLPVKSLTSKLESFVCTTERNCKTLIGSQFYRAVSLLTIFSYQQILQYQMDNNEYEEIVKTCQTHGESDPQLWVQALSYFAKQRQTENCKNQIKQILESCFDAKSL